MRFTLTVTKPATSSDMATTSFLYHSLGLHGYDHCRTEYVNGWVYHHIERKKEKRSCRACGARWHDLRLDGRFERTFFALPIGRRPQFVVLRGHRQHCTRCGRSQREPIPFAKGKRRYLKSFGGCQDSCRLNRVA